MGVSSSLLRFVVQNQELVGAERELRVRPTTIIRELDLVGVGAEDFNGSPYLAADQAVIRQIGGQGDDIEEMN